LQEGLRVLLFARGANGAGTDAGDDGEERLPGGLQPLGVVALRDELRHEAASTVQGLKSAGVGVKVISGDNPETVATLARQAGIDADAAVAGPELEAGDGPAFERRVAETTIFGRITPDQKERIIASLNRRGHHVAMIGDGVNDIPALKRSSVSVAMRSGSPATRAVADIVLLNDSFSVLPPAFLEGQRIRKGMQTIVRLFLVRTLSLALIVLGAALLGDAFPTTPRQAGLPALLGVGLPALILVAVAQPARTARYLLPSSAPFVAPAVILTAIAGLVSYHGFLLATDSVDQARSALVLTQTVCGIWLLPYVERGSQEDGMLNPDRRMLLIAGALLLVLAVWLAIEPARRFSEVEVLALSGYAAVAAVVAAWAVLLHFAWRLTSTARRDGAEAPA
jgi:cation-transporting ATPase E